MIVDVHAHLGYDEVFERDFSREELLAGHQANGVDVSIVQPSTAIDLPGARERHDAIAALLAEFPGQFAGMACHNPHLDNEAYLGEARRCVRDMGFVGLKLHTLAHALWPASKAGRRVFAVARELDVPVMIHTGSGLPWASPAQVLPIAREFPAVRVVLAHSGTQILATDALAVAQVCHNVYLETSWVPGHLIKAFVRALGPERVMFGSDQGYNVAIELFKYRGIGLTDAELEWVLGRTSVQVYRLRTKPGPS
ncbi:MAG: amidohydrolase family protein [Chloroflexi bacterium]|nr:amidohydrolase family protein [Chloroflexota bacterium]MCL5110680.1 amidohydrolase family protein [Chloroflexota bacterium]